MSEFVLESALVRADETLARIGPASVWMPSGGRRLWRPSTPLPREVPRLGRLLEEPSVFEHGY